MADPTARRAHAILRRLIELDPGQRDEEAVRACNGDIELLRRVRHLLGAVDRTRGFLETPVVAAIDASSLLRASPAAGAPSIPGFRIERLLGSGGMAAVHLATQEWPRRRVALKVMRRSVAGTTALKRFEFETEVLARLRHPGIAQLYEAGTFDDGAGLVPYLAMEFVEDGRPITTYCNEERLDLRARIELMVAVCDAVQHGHQNGVIHRDLKSGNVLVGAEGRPKVIDFGIARSTVEGELARATTAGQIIGTLGAMSPEQCTPNAAVDARTDVYSLGVLLYELACRRPPHELGDLPIPQALRTVQVVAPPRPSAIDASLRGDVEAIVLKAMEKDPDRRYNTVAALAADLRRYLDHQTVEARPPTLLYQLRLFARRHRAFVSATLIAAGALVAATAMSTWMALVAGDEVRQRRAAEDTATRERDAALRHSYAANVAAALSAFQSGQFGQMRQYLEAAPISHRGWEWRWLSSFADSSVARVDTGDRMVYGLSMSDDAARLATLGRDGTVRCWLLPELANGSETRPQRASSTDIAWLPGGTRAVVPGDDGSLIVLEFAADGAGAREVARLRLGRGRLRSVSPRDASTVVVVTTAGLGEVWDLEHDERLATFSDASGPILAARVSADGAWILSWASAGLSGGIAGGGVATLRDGSSFDRRLTVDIEGDPQCGLVRSDLDRFVIGGSEGRVTVCRLSDGVVLDRLNATDRVSLVRSLAISADGSLLAVGQGNGAITLFELRPGGRQVALLGHADAVSGLAFSADCSRLLSSSWDGSLRAWDMRTSTVGIARSLEGAEDRAKSVAFAPRGPLLASGGVNGTVRLWNTDGDEPPRVLRGHSDEVNDVVFSPDGALIASASDDGTVRLWESDSGAALATLVGHGNDVWAVDISPDGRWLASCGSDRTIRLWNLATRETTQTLVGHTERVTNVLFSHDGRRLASASRDGTVRLWTVDDGRLERELIGHESDVFALAWSADDAILYSGSRDQTIGIWSTETGARLDMLEGARQFVTCLALSPDGSRLAAGTWFGGVTLFQPGHREPVASFRVAPGVLRGIAFSGDGRLLALTAGDGSIRLLDGGAAQGASDENADALTIRR